MPRFDTRRYAPPVRIWRTNAITAQTGLQTNVSQTAAGAGDWGQREARFASVPIRLRINKNAGTNRPAATAATIPIGHTRRKRGLPPITLPDTVKGG